MSRFLALDFETSGTSKDRNQPVSLGLAVMDGDVVEACHEWLIAPKRHYKTDRIIRNYDVEALEVSRYTWPQIKREGIDCHETCKQVARWSFENKARMLPIVAFNAEFDFGFWRTLMYLGDVFDERTRTRKAFVSPLLGGWNCAMQLAQWNIAGLENYQLDTVASHFDLAREGEKHSAVEDAVLAGRIYHRLTTAEGASDDELREINNALKGDKAAA